MEGPMNIDPATTEVENEATPEPEAPAEKPTVIDVPAGQAVHFPTPQPRLTAGGQKVFNALRPAR